MPKTFRRRLLDLAYWKLENLRQGRYNGELGPQMWKEEEELSEFLSTTLIQTKPPLPPPLSCCSHCTISKQATFSHRLHCLLRYVIDKEARVTLVLGFFFEYRPPGQRPQCLWLLEQKRSTCNFFLPSQIPNLSLWPFDSVVFSDRNGQLVQRSFRRTKGDANEHLPVCLTFPPFFSWPCEMDC